VWVSRVGVAYSQRTNFGVSSLWVLVPSTLSLTTRIVGVVLGIAERFAVVGAISRLAIKVLVILVLRMFRLTGDKWWR
jgi:phage shock protein PspC (stress-responsive transcriptional regulator)